MLAKVAAKRKDGKSSFSALAKYATDRPEEKERPTDELNPGYTRRNHAILVSAREDLQAAANYLRAVRRIDIANADAIREHLDRLGASSPADGSDDESLDRQPGGPVGPRSIHGKSEQKGVSHEHLRSLASARKNLVAAGRNLRKTRRVDPDFSQRARARRANLTFLAGAAERRNRLDERDPLQELESLLGDHIVEFSSSGIACHHNCLSLATAPGEMDAVAAQNSRVKDPVYHVILSWPAEENPTDEQAFECALYAKKAVGMEGHQHLFAIHRDTDNVHLHMTVNRVHPDSFLAVYPDRDYFKLDYAMRELEIKYGWKHDDGPFRVVQNGVEKTVTWKDSTPKLQGKLPTKAADMERHADLESLFTYVRQKPRTAIRDLLRSDRLEWASLHAELAKFNLGIKPKGRGLCIYDLGDSTITAIKASDMHEELSINRLRKRIGEYRPATALAENVLEVSYDKYSGLKRDPSERAARREERAKLRRDTRARYQKYRSEFVTNRIDKEQVRNGFKAISEEARRKRTNIRKKVSDPKDRKAFYSIVAFEALRAREKYKFEIKRKRQELASDPANKRLTYKEWVEREASLGDPGAISQLRGFNHAEQRNRAKEQFRDSIRYSAHTDPTLVAAPGYFGIVRRDGTVAYRSEHSNRVVLDDGEKLMFEPAPGEHVQREIAFALHHLRAKAGSGFEVSGEQAFSDAAREALTRQFPEVPVTSATQPRQHPPQVARRRKSRSR